MAAMFTKAIEFRDNNVERGSREWRSRRVRSFYLTSILSNGPSFAYLLDCECFAVPLLKVRGLNRYYILFEE